MEQVTSHVLMIRPSAFGYNIETAENNTFQNQPKNLAPSEINEKARNEFDQFVQILRNEGINVTVLEDTVAQQKPDAIFPNNWISFHQDGTVITYPMYSGLRRHERREDVIDTLATEFEVRHRVHYEQFESQGKFLEGTGSLVLDRAHNVAYACISERTDISIINEWCDKMDYTPHTFLAESNGKAIYHTNVMMAIGSEIAIVCLECLPLQDQREDLFDKLSDHHEVVQISMQQVESFAGNMLALKNGEGEELMVMSRAAYKSLSEEQISTIEKYCRIVSAPIYTIENIGGGSARCMIAEIFLEPKQ